MAALMMQTGMAFMVGFGIGFFNSIPFGPISFSIIETGFKKGFRQAFMIGLGALVIDVLYCVVGVFGISMIKEYVETVFQPLGFPVMAVLGGRLIALGWKNDWHRGPLMAVREQNTKHFSLGFIMVLTNPLAMSFWVVTMGFLFAYGFIQSTMSDKIGFIVGMTFGTGIWFFLLARWVSWRREAVSVAVIRRISIGTGIVLVLFGVWLGYQYSLTLWSSA